MSANNESEQESLSQLTQTSPRIYAIQEDDLIVEDYRPKPKRFRDPQKLYSLDNKRKIYTSETRRRQQLQKAKEHIEGLEKMLTFYETTLEENKRNILQLEEKNIKLEKELALSKEWVKNLLQQNNNE